MTAVAPLKVFVITASRSEYGLMRWIIRDLADDPNFKLGLVVTGAHLSHRHGHTVDEIRADGFLDTIDIPMGLDESAGLGQALAQEIGGIESVLAREAPDIVLILGDRWEMLGVASACTVRGIPIGHFSGGEITEGVLDDSVRHALTKLSHLHFVANETYADRVRQMGEEDWRILTCGGPGLDNFIRLPLLDPHSLSKSLGLDVTRPTAVVTLHPPTQSPDSVTALTAKLVAALETARIHHGLQYVITGPCADPGADHIEKKLREFITRTGAGIYVPSLGQVRYLSLLKVAAVMIGNSSSAFHEAPVAGLWAVNIGDRQEGRISGGNVISVKVEEAAIVDGISRALAMGRGRTFTCPYGSGSASPQVRQFLLEIFTSRGRGNVLRKRFIDRPWRMESCTP